MHMIFVWVFFSENEKIHPSGLPTIGLDFGDNCMGVAHFSTFLDLIDGYESFVVSL